MPRNYTTLLSDITNFLDNTDVSSDLISANIIPLAEIQVARDLKVEDFTLVTTGTLTVGVTNLSLPSNLTLPLSIHITDGGSVRALEQKDYGYLTEAYPSTTASGVPVYYARENASQWRIAPLPATAHPFRIRYNGQPAPLNASAGSTNVMTDLYYDVLLARCMANAALYMQDDTRTGLITVWNGEYQRLVNVVNGVDVSSESDEYRAPNVPGTAV